MDTAKVIDETFWFVWNRDGKAPRHRHATYNAALFEARRLALANPGQEFIVLESRCSVKAEMPVNVTEHIIIPF